MKEKHFLILYFPCIFFSLHKVLLIILGSSVTRRCWGLIQKKNIHVTTFFGEKSLQLLLGRPDHVKVFWKHKSIGLSDWLICQVNQSDATCTIFSQTVVYMSVVKYRIYQVVGDTLDNGLGWCMLASFSASHLSTYSSFLLSSQSFQMFKNVQKFSKNCNKYTQYYFQK